jgi:hypothetical protein
MMLWVGECGFDRRPSQAACAVKTTVLLPHKPPGIPASTLLALRGHRTACADPHFILADMVFMMLKQVYRLEGLDGAKCVQRLDDSQIVQIALRFAFHCVLHRCKSLEIHC